MVEIASLALSERGDETGVGIVNPKTSGFAAAVEGVIVIDILEYARKSRSEAT